MKIKIRIDDPQTRAVWEAALKAKDEVDHWPAWKRGEGPTPPTAPATDGDTPPRSGRSEE